MIDVKITQTITQKNINGNPKIYGSTLFTNGRTPNIPINGSNESSAITGFINIPPRIKLNAAPSPVCFNLRGRLITFLLI